MAVDEFGAASGSLAQLGNILAGEIKLDRTFFRGALTNPKQARILDAIVAMAHRLDIRVIANGVDSEALLRFALRDRLRPRPGASTAAAPCRRTSSPPGRRGRPPPRPDHGGPGRGQREPQLSAQDAP